MVESNPTQIFKITPGQDIKLELDGDGIPDLLVTYNEKVGTKADLTWKRIELTPVEKIIAQPVYIAKQTLGKWWYVHSLVYAIALLEVLLGIFLYAGFVRGRHVDANLIRYISLGRHQGFKDEHIMEKLLKHGWTKEEISWALKQLKEK